MSDDAVLKDELRSAIEAPRELGEELEPAVIGVIAVCVALA